MFKDLKKLVAERFNQLVTTGQLFYVEVDRDKIVEIYLDGFESEHRQEHNCSCCKSFLRQYGGIVGIINNKVQTLWDVPVVSGFFNSTNALDRYIKSLPIAGTFLSPLSKLGTDKNLDRERDLVWEHFHLILPTRFMHQSRTITLDTVLSEARANKEVLKRGLDEIKSDAIETVLDLISQGSLYRGNEFKPMVEAFKDLQTKYIMVPTKLRDNFAWNISTLSLAALCKIRNSSIGTLLVELSEDAELDAAVRRFEAMVAPTNYKRPTALVTPKMVENAKTELQELGVLESLQRRFAQPNDLDINNILYVDKSSSLTDVFDEIKKDAQVTPKQFSKVDEIAIGDFISKVLPKAKTLHVLLENNHLNKFVTLLTAKDADAPLLFKWGNPFSWAYTGGITDSIKERVKAAGGRTDADLRVSLSWHNHDDLDVHVIEPRGNRIYFGAKRSPSTDGWLDVDMNAGYGMSREPVENITWKNKSSMSKGVYQVLVHNYNRRESSGVGFTIQVAFGDETYEYSFANNPKQNEYINVVEVTYNGKDLTVSGESKSTVADKEKWNLKTNRLHKVKNVLLSPNHWDGAVGNKHFLFLLENCASDEETRPFFNEFIQEKYSAHRKFFEVLGDKLKLSPTTNQLAGIGFSDTQRSSVIVQVDGSFKRLLKINF